MPTATKAKPARPFKPTRPRKPAKPNGKGLGALPEWNLADLYPGIDAPEVKRDLDRADADCVAFEEAYKGKLATLAAGLYGGLLDRGIEALAAKLLAHFAPNRADRHDFKSTVTRKLTLSFEN